jgi:hypothetical protein
VQGQAGLEPGSDEILHDLLLPVDGDGRAGQVGEVDAVRVATEAQRDALMGQSLSGEAFAEADLVHQVDGGLLQDARPHAVLDVVPAPGLDDDRFDALKVQQVAQHQPGRPGSHDRHLCADRS